MAMRGNVRCTGRNTWAELGLQGDQRPQSRVLAPFSVADRSTMQGETRTLFISCP